MVAELSRCRSCDAPIRWAKTAKGNTMPLDPDPVEDGTFALTEDGAAVHVGENALYIAKRYKSHFATCPFAGRHRRGAAREAADRANQRAKRGL